MPRRKRETDRRQGSAHADSTLLHTTLGKPDDVEPGQPLAETHLDLHRIGFDPDEARSMRSGEHARVKSTTACHVPGQ